MALGRKQALVAAAAALYMKALITRVGQSRIAPFQNHNDSFDSRPCRATTKAIEAKCGSSIHP
jgi:hypothetical protein